MQEILASPQGESTQHDNSERVTFWALRSAGTRAEREQGEGRGGKMRRITIRRKKTETKKDEKKEAVDV